VESENEYKILTYRKSVFCL